MALDMEKHSATNTVIKGFKSNASRPQGSKVTLEAVPFSHSVQQGDVISPLTIYLLTVSKSSC